MSFHGFVGFKNIFVHFKQQDFLYSFIGASFIATLGHRTHELRPSSFNLVWQKGYSYGFYKSSYTNVCSPIRHSPADLLCHQPDHAIGLEQTNEL